MGVSGRICLSLAHVHHPGLLAEKCGSLHRRGGMASFFAWLYPGGQKNSWSGEGVLLFELRSYTGFFKPYCLKRGLHTQKRLLIPLGAQEEGRLFFASFQLDEPKIACHKPHVPGQSRVDPSRPKTTLRSYFGE